MLHSIGFKLGCPYSSRYFIDIYFYFHLLFKFCIKLINLYWFVWYLLSGWTIGLKPFIIMCFHFCSGLWCHLLLYSCLCQSLTLWHISRGSVLHFRGFGIYTKLSFKHFFSYTVIFLLNGRSSVLVEIAPPHSAITVSFFSIVCMSVLPYAYLNDVY